MATQRAAAVHRRRREPLASRQRSPAARLIEADLERRPGADRFHSLHVRYVSDIEAAVSHTAIRAARFD